MIAVISDIHGNLEALEAVLEDAGRESVDRIVCLGDVVGYGANPNECLDRVRTEAAAVVLGNHDAAAVNLELAEGFNEVARTAIRWTFETLREDNREALRTLPMFYVEGGARYVHASPDEPEAWHYVQTEEEAWISLEACPEPICFIGHSHVPFRVLVRGGRMQALDTSVLELKPDDRVLVNVGSVGQPRDGDWRASYAIFDEKAGRIVARRVEYDIERATTKIREAGLPEVLAARLAVGQ
ncbi:metallophosphatase family protein [bacterium]|nr:metallophosphatase family protein [bacterium]